MNLLKGGEGFAPSAGTMSLPGPCQWKVGPSSKMQCLGVARVGQWAVRGKRGAGTESHMTLEVWELLKGFKQEITWSCL